MKVVCCAKKIHSVVCVCMGTSDAIDKKERMCCFVLSFLVQLGECNCDHLLKPLTANMTTLTFHSLYDGSLGCMQIPIQLHI